MSHLTSRQRQLVYLAGILVLMAPIVVLGMPTTEQQGALGVIAQRRIEFELGEPSLGNVDPASATMNLVLLGLRGVAANLLWMEADHLKSTKNWSQLESTVESIILLQPHFQSVWKFQAWNLGYNVSAECDAVEDRFFWVKKGMKFLIRGTERNQKVPELFHDAGDYFGKKIGRSDEKVLFRRFFMSDPDVERWGGRPDGEINRDHKDNYLVAKDWYITANEKLSLPGVEQHKMAAPLFMGYPYRSQMDYATALQGERSSQTEILREAWATGYREWTEGYGRIDFDTPGGMVRFEADNDELARISAEDGIPFEDKLYWQQKYQDMCNYRYWKLRCNAERDPRMVMARDDLYRGRRLFREDVELAPARDALFSGLSNMQQVVDQYRLPDGTSQLLDDDIEVAEDALKGILIWQYVLGLLGERAPEEFPMDEVWNDPRYESLRADLHQRFVQWQGGSL